MTSDAKVRVETSDLTAFSDASVVCGELRTSPIEFQLSDVYAGIDLDPA